MVLVVCPPSLFTLSRPSTSSALQITDRCFRYAPPSLCNQPWVRLFRQRQPHSFNFWLTWSRARQITIFVRRFTTLTVFHTFTPGLKRTCFTIFPMINCWLPSRLLLRTETRTRIFCADQLKKFKIVFIDSLLWFRVELRACTRLNVHTITVV